MQVETCGWMNLSQGGAEAKWKNSEYKENFFVTVIIT